MKIRMFSPPGSSQGAHKFARLLQGELAAKYAYNIVRWDDESPCDVAMARGGISPAQLERVKKNNEKLVIQYGGADFAAPHSKRVLAMSMRAATGIVYNSRFGRETVHKYLGEFSAKEKVIYNGSSKGPRAPLNKHVCMVACDSYVMPAKQHALKVAIEAIEIIKQTYPDAELVIVGKMAEKQARQGIAYGHIDDHDKLQKLRSSASVLIHMVEEDNCPNTVVEALGQGVPVVCHANSGTPEIVRYFGFPVREMDPEQVASSAISLMCLGPKWQSKWLADFDQELSIEAVAGKYNAFLESL